MAQPALVQAREVHALELNLARRRFEQSQDRAPCCALPAAALSHQPERIPGVQGEVDAVDSPHDFTDGPQTVPPRNREVLLQSFDYQEWIWHRVGLAGAVC